MKTINEYINEKLKITKSSSEENTTFNIIKLFEEVMGMRYENSATEDFKNKVNAFADECINDYRDIEIVTDELSKFGGNATIKIIELGKTYKFEKIGPSKWEKYSDILHKSKKDKIIEADFGDNPIDEDITISHYEKILEYTSMEGGFIIKA